MRTIYYFLGTLQDGDQSFRYWFSLIDGINYLEQFFHPGVIKKGHQWMFRMPHFCFVGFCHVCLVLGAGSLGACSTRFDRILLIKCLKWTLKIFHCFVEDCLWPFKRLSERLLLFGLSSECWTQALLWSLTWWLFILWKYIKSLICSRTQPLIIFEQVQGRRLWQILVYDLPIPLDGGSLIHDLFFQIINFSFEVWAHRLNDCLWLLI